jgi:hypothetical protein
MSRKGKVEYEDSIDGQNEKLFDFIASSIRCSVPQPVK